jgi:solute carrier family 25 (mitochondrial oxoglutarate transporter), member 11
MLAGACGAAVGSPADLILVRMQADGRLPVEKRVYNYSSVFNGIYRVVKNESVIDLWRGSGPTVIRAMLVTASQLSVYDVLKTFVVGNGYMKDGTAVHFSCSFIAGFVAAVATNPVDVVKTRLMNQSKASVGSGVYYKGMTDCFVSTLKLEGFAGLYKVRLTRSLKKKKKKKSFAIAIFC